MDTKYKVVFLAAADQNLLDIDEYLSRFYQNTAADFFEALDKKILLLQDMPYIGAEFAHDKKYRRLVVGNYVVFYIVDEERHIVEIHRILHGAQDAAQHL